MSLRICFWLPRFVSRFKKNLMDFSPCAYQSNFDRMLTPSAIWSYIESSYFVCILYDWKLSSMFKLPSSSVSVFSNNVLFSFRSFVRFSEYLIVNSQILYFKSFPFNWAFRIKFWLLWKVWIKFLVFLT